MSLVLFYNADVKIYIKKKRKLIEFIAFLFSNENKKLQSLSIIVCSDEYLLQLNNQFLKHNYYTDVLTFNLSNNENISGEIYISIDRVKENALLQHLSFEQEFYRIVFHGSLHLCGYGDKSKVKKQIMTAKEDFYLKEFASFHVKQN